jgi:N-acetylmuramoyl-L-alanine amidase
MDITREYIKFGKARSGNRLTTVRGIVSHDTGNEGSTAYNNRSYFNNHQPSASAHTFIDDKYILEIVPLYEKAWHVRYDKDKKLAGVYANDYLIGVELCWGGKIDFKQAYEKYVWYHAYLCKTFNLNPKRDIYSHKQLDPGRKTDPDNALNRFGITWTKFLDDVFDVYMGKAKEDDIMSQEFKPTVGAINDSVKTVLARFEQKDPALAASWRKKFNDGELTISDAVGLLYVAVERGYIVGE